MALDSAQLIILDGFFNSIGRKKAWELIKKQLQNFSDGEDLLNNSKFYIENEKYKITTRILNK